MDEIGCKRRQPIIVILRPAVFDRYVLALDIAGLLKALEERNGEVLVFVINGQSAEIPNHRRRRLLGPRRERPRHRAPEPRDESPALHWIMSSAVANSVSGMVKPSALAVFRLMTSSNFVGCMTGRSEGLSPLRMRPA